MLERVTDLLLASEGSKPAGQISKPLAIVFTKMDTLLHDLKKTSPLLRSPPEEPYFDERDSLAVHTEIQRLLARWEGTRIDQIAQLNYRTLPLFRSIRARRDADRGQPGLARAASALTGSPTRSCGSSPSSESSR